MIAVFLEASPNIFAKLSDNLRRNQATNVEATNVAISDRQGTTKLFLGSDSNLGQTGTVSRPGSPLRMRRRDHAPRRGSRRDRPRAGAIREGGCGGRRWPVLQGMRDLLRRGAPALEVFVEVTPTSLRASDKTVDDVLAMFAESGFLPDAIENDYSAEGYMSPGVSTRPRRLRRPVSEQTDVIFSED